MKYHVTILVCATLALCGLARADTLWSIGTPDNSYDEFACARNYGAYTSTFPHDVTYVVGRSTPGKDWSYIHPGLTDSWASGTRHPFAIEFELASAPDGPLRLSIDLVDVHGAVPSALDVDVNGRKGTLTFERGAGDETLTNPAHGREQKAAVILSRSLFVQGKNTITLVSTGSWVLYDYLALETAEATEVEGATSLTLEPTILIKKSPATGRLANVILATVRAPGGSDELTLRVRVGGRQTSETTIKPGVAFGDIVQEILVDEVTAETALEVTATTSGASATAKTTVRPERHWRIYIAPATHTDIGYTDLQENVYKRHLENTDTAMRLCGEYPGFGWNLETAWQADLYDESRPRPERERLWELARAQRIGVQANYLNMLTGLCSGEELNRWLYFAHSLKRDHGVPFESATITDVPSQVWSLPTTLAAAGIRYYANGINNYRGEPNNTLYTGAPFWWEGPDGSRVLAYFAPGYAHAGGPLSSLDSMRTWIVEATRNRDTFPYDALFMYGAFGDNQGIATQCAATADEWAAGYEFPKVIVGPYASYLKYMDEAYGDKLPVLRGDPGVFWEDGAASSAHETTLNRRAHETASAADALAALGQRVTGQLANKPRLRELWKNILLYDEHTWGAWNSISAPDDDFVKSQWEVKASFARAANVQGTQLTTEGLAQLATQVTTDGPALMLFNATGWPRTGEIVEAVVPQGKLPADAVTGKLLDAVLLGAEGDGARIAFRSPTVPAWGYVASPLVPYATAWTAETSSATSQVDPSDTSRLVMENAHLRVSFAPETGAIASCIDKSTGRELVDTAAGQGLNEYAYVSGGDDSKIVSVSSGKASDLTVHKPRALSFEKVILPGLCQRMVVRAEAEKTPELTMTYTLVDGSATVSVDNRVVREETRAKEAVYFAYPFEATQPEVRLEIPNGVVRAGPDQIKGGCTEWFCVQHWARVVGAEGSVAWASPDAPLVCVGDINRGKWPSGMELPNGRLYSYAMNNYWTTNYKAGQGGPMEFRFAFTPEGVGTDAGAARFGWQASMPVLTHTVSSAQEGTLPPAASLVSVSDGSVIITAVKPAEVGRGVVVRLFSLDPKVKSTVISTGPIRFETAELCNLMEEPAEPLELSGTRVRVPLRHLTPVTVVLR